MSNLSEASFIFPRWQLPASVKCALTTRVGGCSTPPFHSLNLGQHVGDLALSVKENRNQVKQYLNLPSKPHWLNQVHSNRVVVPSQFDWDDPPEADAAYTCEPSQVLAIMTADCLPLLLVGSNTTEIAAVHCGWKGVANGIVEKTLEHFKSPRENISAYLGPAIGPEAFEVGEDVRHAFLKLSPTHEKHFMQFAAKWKLDLASSVVSELQRFGVVKSTVSGRCTFSEEDTFFSYRRDGTTGRMAAFIWIND
ncbi:MULTISPECIES: peptidoglycan editing factor PgeF [Gammaproteobacteria]|uniref:peptidoglycan editing factor PgeF n=1 Tax=Gammaproteobacteria TaxID=1236 RepID=UPI000DD0E800|nr:MULTISPECIES: peptidoglycan editing factor PgeF [Gammaproteobacteria]RTE85444.1 peptidoglycan editing factor PgeF [Aliidiomarina sp. B3213]TCZ89411.1 peptidoglycan editing factor PgeF [Lysobacter sp. N42]